MCLGSWYWIGPWYWKQSVDQDQSGSAGVEAGLNTDLRGRNGRVRMTTDVKRHGLDAQVEVQPVPGRSVALTIDSRLQFVADQALAANSMKKAAINDFM